MDKKLQAIAQNLIDFDKLGPYTEHARKGMVDDSVAKLTTMLNQARHDEVKDIINKHKGKS